MSNIFVKTVLFYFLYFSLASLANVFYGDHSKCDVCVCVCLKFIEIYFIWRIKTEHNTYSREGEMEQEKNARKATTMFQK
jgi:hypothetical protein